MSILSQIIAYSPNKIDTEKKAKTLLLAEVPRSEMDNFNTPDLDQGADSILRPGETLEDFDVEFRRPNAQGGRIDFNEGGDATRLKALEADYIQFGKKKLNKAAKVLGFEDYASMSGQENNNFRRKIKQQLTKYGEVLPKGYDSDVRGRKTRIPKEQNIQIKLLEETNKKNFFDPKQFAIDNNISLAKVKKQAERLQTNIYKKRMLEAGKDVGVTLEWIPKDPKFSDNTLNKLWKSKLIKYEREKIDELFYDAFGREKIKGTNKKNPSFNNKKFLAIKKNLNEYRKLRNAINAKYPNINFELDHPLSKSTLKKMFNASAEELTRVNPLEADLNNGFKDAVSQQYEKAMGDPKKGIKPNLNKKKAVEKIARDLKLNIGKINNDATNFKYGVKEFQKLNIKDEIGKSLENLSSLNKNFQTYAKNNPDLFKTANINPNQTFTKLNNVKGLIPFMKELGIKCKLSNGVNCMNPQAYEKSLNELSEKAAQGDQVAKNKLGKFTSKVATSGRVIKNALGPLAIASEVAIEGGIALNKTLETGVPFKQALGDSYINKYLLGPKKQIDVEAERAKEFAKGEDFAMAERGRRMAPFMAQSATADAQRLKDRMKQMEEVKTYENFKPNYGFTKEEFEDTMRKTGSLKENEVYRDDFYKQQVEKPIEFKQLMELPSFKGTQEEFMKGGIASLNVKK